MENQEVKSKPIVIAMKGHPGTGKSTLAQAIARTMKCPLVDKDHFRGCTKAIQEALIQSSPDTTTKLLNDLSYEAMWQVTSAQLGLGLSVVIDSPLSRRTLLDRLLRLAAHYEARLVIVECKPRDEGEWRRRLEMRGVADGANWHKPSTWLELERLLEGYNGCWDYDVGEVPKHVVDTTAPVGIQELVSSVLEFIKAKAGNN